MNLFKYLLYFLIWTHQHLQTFLVELSIIPIKKSYEIISGYLLIIVSITFHYSNYLQVQINSTYKMRRCVTLKSQFFCSSSNSSDKKKIWSYNRMHWHWKWILSIIHLCLVHSCLVTMISTQNKNLLLGLSSVNS